MGMPGGLTGGAPTDAVPAAAVASRRAAFVAGVLAALAAFGVSHLVAGLVAGAPSLAVAGGDLVIALQPPGAKELVVELFGTADKPLLIAGVVAVVAVVAGLIGVRAARDPRAGLVGFGAIGVAGFLLAVRQPLTEPILALLVVVAAVATGLLVLAGLLAIARPRRPSTADAAAASMPDWGRRRFVGASLGVVAASVAAAVAGERLLAPAGAPVGGTAGPGGSPAPDVASGFAGLEVVDEPLPDGASLDVPGLTPIVVPVGDFYRIDTALIVPRVDAATWSLRVHGMVGREVTLRYADLLAMPLFEQHVTIACVSNKVGGDLVGNARWTGVDLREVLAMADVDPAATQLVGRSADGWTAGFPTAWAMDPARRPMIALGMNGAPLPQDHGFPARLIIPGLYGYVSATKWLTEIELTTLEAFDAYWVPLGWAKEAPILTQSRIDLPRAGANVAAGPVTVAGVAWAPDRGVSAVEVRIDDGPWQPATLSVPISASTWVQWTYAWDAAPGTHRVAVRATDGDGVVQTDERTAPAPDGARGHHEVRVNVA